MRSQRGPVLLVEDEDDIRQMLALALEMGGYEVLQAGDGARALELLRRGERPALILLDLMMPGMNGWEFRQAQLAEPQWAEIPVVVLTGDQNARTSEDELRPDALIFKPVGLAALLDTVERLIR